MQILETANYKKNPIKWVEAIINLLAAYRVNASDNYKCSCVHHKIFVSNYIKMNCMPILPKYYFHFSVFWYIYFHCSRFTTIRPFPVSGMFILLRYYINIRNS